MGMCNIIQIERAKSRNKPKPTSQKILLVKYKNLKIDEIGRLKKGIFDLFPKDLLSQVEYPPIVDHHDVSSFFTECF